jgi:hypothetical protein
MERPSFRSCAGLGTTYYIATSINHTSLVTHFADSAETSAQRLKQAVMAAAPNGQEMREERALNEIVNRVLQLLQAALRRQFLAFRRISTTAAEDAILEYLGHPSAFDPSREFLCTASFTYRQVETS